MTRLPRSDFDADDTLWQNEPFFRLTEERFAELLAHAAPRPPDARLLAAERRNLGHYGFGIKGFMLSMIETALEVTEGRVTGDVIAEILAAGREMLRHPVELLPGARRRSRRWRRTIRVLLITKGDLMDQERKLAARASAICSTGSRSSRTRPPLPMPHLRPPRHGAREG